jgi:hypothetical protein
VPSTAGGPRIRECQNIEGELLRACFEGFRSLIHARHAMQIAFRREIGAFRAACSAPL